MFVRHRMFSPVSTFQLSGNCCPSAIPAACGPRNDGQLPERSPARGSRTAASNIVRVTVRGGARFGSPGGAQRVLSRNIRRGAQASPITERRSCLPFTSNRYRPAVPQPSNGTDMAFNSSAPATTSWPASSMAPDCGLPRPCGTHLSDALEDTCEPERFHLAGTRETTNGTPVGRRGSACPARGCEPALQRKQRRWRPRARNTAAAERSGSTPIRLLACCSAPADVREPYGTPTASTKPKSFGGHNVYDHRQA